MSNYERPEGLSYSPQPFVNRAQHNNFWRYYRQMDKRDNKSAEESKNQLKALMKRYGAIAGSGLGILEDVSGKDINDVIESVSPDAGLPHFLDSYIKRQGIDSLLRLMVEQQIMSSIPEIISGMTGNMMSMNNIFLRSMSQGISVAFCMFIDYALRDPEAFQALLDAARVRLDGQGLSD